MKTADSESKCKKANRNYVKDMIKEQQNVAHSSKVQKIFSVDSQGSPSLDNSSYESSDDKTSKCESDVGESNCQIKRKPSARLKGLFGSFGKADGAEINEKGRKTSTNSNSNHKTSDISNIPQKPPARLPPLDSKTTSTFCSESPV